MELRQRSWVITHVDVFPNFTRANINKTFEANISARCSVATNSVNAVRRITIEFLLWRNTCTVSSYPTLHSSRCIRFYHALFFSELLGAHHSLQIPTRLKVIEKFGLHESPSLTFALSLGAEPSVLTADWPILPT